MIFLDNYSHLTHFLQLCTNSPDVFRELMPDGRVIITEMNGMIFRDKVNFKKRLEGYLNKSSTQQMVDNASEHYSRHDRIENMVEGFVVAIGNIT